MIYTCQNKDKAMNFILACDCGCGNALEFKVLDEYLFISALEGSFYAKQDITSVAYERMKNIKQMLMHKETFLHEIIINTEDLFKLRDALNNIVLSPEQDNNYEKITNSAKLVIDVMDAEYGIFAIMLSPIEGIHDFVCGKDYESYALVWNENDLRKFKSYLQSVISNL